MLCLAVTMSLAAALGPSGADPGCVPESDRATFCENGTAWSAGPCEGGEYLICEPTDEFPNLLPTVFQAVGAVGLVLPPVLLAAAVAAVLTALGMGARSLDPTLDKTTTDRLQVASTFLGIAGTLGVGAALSVLATGVLSAVWLWRQGLEVVQTKDDSGRRVTLYGTTGLGRSSPLASFRTDHERDCHNEIARLAAEDHFFKVAEIWTRRNRSILDPLDPWKTLPRMPDRTPQSARMTPQKCQAQLEGGATQVRRARDEVARMQKELGNSEEQAREDLRECALKTNACTCNCEAHGGAGGVGGAGGQGGEVSLGPNGTPEELLARLTEAFGPDVKVADKDGFIQVPLREVVLFDTDKDTLTPAASAILARAAEVLAKIPDVRIVVEGHASAPGSLDYNLDLSKRRARAVVAALVGMGVAKSRIVMTALGKTRPEVPTEKEEQRNRRVLIRLEAAPANDGGEPRPQF